MQHLHRLKSKHILQTISIKIALTYDVYFGYIIVYVYKINLKLRTTFWIHVQNKVAHHIINKYNNHFAHQVYNDSTRIVQISVLGFH